MRDPKRRIKKYKAKIDGDVARVQTEAYSKIQKRLFKGRVSDQVKIERAVRSIIQSEGISPIFNHYYMAFAKQLNKIIEKFKGETLATEVEILQDTWKARGLESSLLGEIKVWFGLPAPPLFCLFDVGLFDVCLFG